MNPTAADHEYDVLTTPDGEALLREVVAVVDPSPSQITRWRRNASAERVAAALRIASGRRKGAAKFANADLLWLDPAGIEQATAEPVARHKAARFAGRRVIDLCSGVGGDSLAMAASGARVIAVDLDLGMCRRLRWNARVEGCEDCLLPVRGRAEDFAIASGALVHIDPDRRASLGRRARSVADYAPGLDTLKRIARETAGGAIKLGPASDFDAHFADPGLEIELISLNGECKEATVWLGESASCRRRATTLPDGATWTDRDGAPGDLPEQAHPARFVAAVDPALSRSGLAPRFAVVQGLSQVALQGNLLTADRVVEHPFLTWFKVRDVLPLDRRSLKSRVQADGMGPLEIKVFGVRVAPELLRKELQPPGFLSTTLILYPEGNSVRVIIADRLGP
jgi:hypothetical protein